MNNYKIITLKPKSKYLTDNIIKFINYPNKIIKESNCNDKEYDTFNSEWDIYILWIDKNNINQNIRNNLYNFFKNTRPMYACFGENYIVITKIISKQIYTMSKNGCTLLGILDLYLYEMGAVLVENKLNIKPLREFKGTYGLKVIWNVSEQDVGHITKKMHGWFARDTELMLIFILKNCNYKIVCELGSWLGCSTSCILKNMKPETELYCFDKFQNIMNSNYHIDGKSPIDDFYIKTPRFETFYKNISPFLKNKKCYTIKHDVKYFIPILSERSIIPDIVFIDAIKYTTDLIKILKEIYNFNPNMIVIGDDYVFDSVKKAIEIFKKDHENKYNIYEYESCYCISPIKLPIINYLNKNRFPNNKYELIKYQMEINNFKKIKLLLNDIDINKPIKKYNMNTFYTLIVAKIYTEKNSQLKELKKYIDSKFKPKPIKNILGLTYLDYINNKNLFY